MGIVQRQSFWNMIYTTIGVVLGAVNKLLLYSVWLSKVEFGLIELLLSFAVVGTEFSLLGSGKIINRFFPYFKDNPKRQARFVGFVASYVLLGFFVMVLILLVLRPWLVQAYTEKSPLFAHYYFYLIPFSFGFVSYKVLKAFSQVLLKSVVPNFSFHVGMRAFHMIIIFGFFYEWISFDSLLLLYVFGYSIPGFLISAYLVWLKKLAFSLDFKFWRSRLAKMLIVYGFFVLLADASLILLGRIDSMMIGAFLGVVMTGPYGIAFYMANLINMPKNVVNQIITPLIAIRYAERNWVEIAELYQKNAMVNLLLGGLVLVGIWANIDSFFEILPKHIEGRNAAILMGIGFLISIASGPNRLIVIVSKHFRFDLYLNLVLLCAAIVSNYFLIPLWGLSGAALATAVTLSLYNIGGTLFVYYKFKISPYTSKTLLAVLVLLITLFVGFYLPVPEDQIWAILIRSTCITLLFAALVYPLKLLPDANELIKKQLKRKGIHL